ncbi:MAG: asparagine synthase (glutamine-hydrolyzing), partial [Bacteroidota bacterium]
AKTPAIKKHLTLNNKAVNQFLNLGYIPSPESIYTQIKKLPPGFTAKYSNNKLTLRQYWKADEKIKKEAVKNEDSALSELKSIIESSVSQSLVSDVPFGTFLSGGIDSSLVTAIAQKYSKEPINTFSIAFSDSKYNEAIWAKKVATHLGTNHHEFEVTQKQALEWIPSLMDIYDEPFADSSALPTLLVSKLARDKVTMVLSGDGGDELFMGYGSYVWAKRLANPAMPILRYPAAALLNTGNQRMKRASNLFRYKNKKTLKSHIFSQEQYFFSRKEIKNLLNKEFQHDFYLDENPENLNRRLSVSEQQALFDLKHYLPDDLLVKVDRASMHFSLETRVPLLDYRMVEFALNLDKNLKIKNNTSKYLLRKLLAEYIPKEYFDRPKWGFAIPLGSWMKNELKDFCMKYLDDEIIKKHGIFNTEYVKKLKYLFWQKDQSYLYNRLWQIIVLQMWMDK